MRDSIKLLIGGTFSIWIGQAGISAHSNDKLLDVSVAYSAVSGTLLGFLIAAVSILTAVVNRRLIQNMRKTGHYSILLQELFGTALLLLLATVAGLCALLAPDDWIRNLMWVCVSALAFGILLLVSAGRKFYIVMVNII